jgi:hypothetical protein
MPPKTIIKSEDQINDEARRNKEYYQELYKTRYQRNQYGLPLGYKTVGNYVTNGKATGSVVIEGPDGGQYIENTKGNLVSIPAINRNKVIMIDEKMEVDE